MKFLYFLAFLFLLINCTPPRITYTRVIENDSNHDILLINLNSGGGCLQDSVLLVSNTSHTLDFTEQRNASVNDFANCPFVCIDTVGTRINNHDSLNLAFPLESTNPNWQYRVINSGESGSCECRLVINDSDIN